MNPHVTTHALNRFIERVDASEPFPRSRIGREFANAVPVDLDGVGAETWRHPESGAVYLVQRRDGEAHIVTCFVATPGQLGEHGQVGVVA